MTFLGISDDLSVSPTPQTSTDFSRNEENAATLDGSVSTVDNVDSNDGETDGCKLKLLYYRSIGIFM